MRRKSFNIRFSGDELARADALAKYYGLTVAGLIRMLIKREERRIEDAKRLSGPLYQKEK
jgi:antitoxin component of RelBE/YafQ-DinJ toxin-antitoxin module